MIKNELEIAKELWTIRTVNKRKGIPIYKIVDVNRVKQHLSDYERFLEFLKENYDSFDDLYCKEEKNYLSKIKDLMDVINYHKERLK